MRSLQVLLNAHRPAGAQRRLRVDGICGVHTVAAIEAAQRRFVGLYRPDGRVDPHGPMLRALNALEKAVPRERSAAAAAERAGTAPIRIAAAPSPAPRAPPADVVLAAQVAQRRWRVPASISIAQWVLESGEGRHMPPGSNNPFGIKARPGQPAVVARTREETRDGRSYHIQAAFRGFESLEEAFDAHGRLLATAHAYERARRHLDDSDAYADALTGTYATDTRYGALLKRIMHHRDLYRYDRSAGPADR